MSGKDILLVWKRSGEESCRVRERNKRWVLVWTLGMVLLLTGGCGARRRAAPLGVTPIYEEPQGHRVPSAVESLRPGPAVVVPPSTGVFAPVLVPAPKPEAMGIVTNTPVRSVWTSVGTWAVTNELKLEPMRMLQGEYVWSTPHGLMSFRAGSMVGRWEGASFWLSTPPRLTARGDLELQSLDLAKLCRPLLEPSFGVKLGKRVVVVDAGHGGRSLGTRSVVDGRLEKEFTLDWGLRLSKLLKAKGWNVVMTRTNDVDVAVEDRIALANSVGAGFFVSLHFNAESTHTQSGLEAYCLTPVGMASHLQRDQSDRPDVECVNNRFDDDNTRLGMRVHHAMIKGAGVADRGLRRARYPAVLRNQNCPAVLVEGGYLSHRTEAVLISKPEYRQRLAEALARVFE